VRSFDENPLTDSGEPGKGRWEKIMMADRYGLISDLINGHTIYALSNVRLRDYPILKVRYIDGLKGQSIISQADTIKRRQNGNTPTC